MKTIKLLGRKCFGCKFCLWFSDWQDYRCSITGCYEYSKFKEYNGKK